MFSVPFVRRQAALWLPLSALLILLALASESVEAHANLVESDPAVNSVLPKSPDRVTIRFTEPLEPALSGIQVLDAQGRRVDDDDSAVDPDDSHLMSVSVGTLENGTYTVAWKNVSTVDGHRVRGAFVFSVGEPISTSVSPADLEQPILQSPAEPAVRWLILLDILSVVGGMTFLILVARPALDTPGIRSGDISDLRRVLSWGVMSMAFIASVSLIVASVAQLLIQASVVYETSAMGALGEPLRSLLAETDWGRLWIRRMLLVVPMTALLAVGWRRIRTEPEPRSGPALIYVATVLGLGVC